MKQIEILDRDNRVVMRTALDASAFPLTVRLVEEPSAQSVASSPLPDVPPLTYRPSLLDTILAACSKRRVAFGLMLAICAMAFADLSLKDTGKRPWAMGIGGIFAVICLSSLWAGAWTLSSRISKGEGRYRSHLSWTFIAFMLLGVLTQLVSWLHFLMPSSDVLFAFATIVFLAAIATVFAGHLRLMPNAVPRQAWRRAITAVVVLTVFSGIGAYITTDDFDTAMHYEAVLKPLDARWIPSESVSEFGKDVNDLKEEIDKHSK